MTASSSSLSRPLLAALCCLFVALPYLSVTYPPITDLPQHSAQIRLFLEALESGDTSPYSIQWGTPYSLSYLIIGACWALFGPAHAGRIALLVVALIWVVSVHLLAWRRDKSPAAAVLAVVFVFNQNFYWGFYSFALGAPIFLLWFTLTTGEAGSRPSLRNGLTLFAVSVLLYMSHVLWFLAAAAWLGLITLVHRPSLRVWLFRTAVVLPVLVFVAIWYPSLSTSSMSTPLLWLTTPFDRLSSFSWLTDAALGGVRGPLESVAFGLVILWLVLGGALRGRESLREVDRDMLLAAALFFGMVLVGPDKFMNTINLGHRWMPVCLIMTVLAAPVPKVRPVLRQAVALVVLAGFCAVTSLTWMAFERKELSGLDAALRSLPQNPKVLGLSLMRDSEFVKNWPFIQTFAYSQVLKGGEINFSFAEFSPCLVVYRRPFISPWTHGLEWYPDRVTPKDFGYFDYLLVSGNEPVHEVTRRQDRLEPVTREGRWRLYRVITKRNGPEKEVEAELTKPPPNR